MKTLQILFTLFALLCCNAFNASAQISIASDGFTYDQNFENLIPSSSVWSNNSTIPNWYATSANGALTTYESANNAVSGIHSYGTVNNERAMGTVAAGGTGTILFGAHFRNNSGFTITLIELSFRAEHWRSPNSNVIGHQRTTVSYAIANSIAVTDAALLANNSFIDLPEATLITLDTTGFFAALNGNSSFAVVNIQFPVSIPNGSEFFLRFKDEDIANEFDAGLAVDNLHMRFSTDVVPRIVGSSGENGSNGYNVFQYLDMGIVADIPSKANSPAYLNPTNDMDEWQQILESFYDDDDLDDVNASAYGYEAVEFYDQDGRYYQVLRKQNHSAYYWGTYVKTINSSSKIIIQGPHAVDDVHTGTQSAAVFYISQASGLMISGISRCSSNVFSNCSGQTRECSVDNSYEPFQISDVPHETNSIFQLATTVLANQQPSLVFVQLHGSEQKVGDPDFVISCGTINAQLKSVPDYPVILRENLFLENPDLQFKISHVDSYTPLAAQTNVQGRYLNLYPANICTASAEPGEVTNRFLHIEQFPKYRKCPDLVAQLANALYLTIPDTGYDRSILITSDPEYFPAEYFSNLDYPEASNTWGNNLRVLGWYAVHEETPDDDNIPDGLFSTYGLDNSPVPGGLYAFGSPVDYSLGSFSTPSVTGDMAYGVLFKNNTGVTLYQMNLTYNAEQWRVVPSRLHRVTLGYTISNQIDLSPAGILYGSFTNIPAGDMIATDDGALSWQDGNLNITPISVTEVPIVLNPDEEIFIRFFDNDDASSDEVMALDDFEINFSSLPPPMPVDWLYFNITKKNGRPSLQWAADNETECKNYEVLRSDDGKDFESIATISCNGQALNNQYEFIDYTPAWQRNVYYKIAQYDGNGDVSYSPLKSFNSNAVAKPAVNFKNGEVIIETSKESKLLSVAVFDFMGRQFCQGTPVAESNSRYTFDCPNAANQLVIVQLIFDSGNYAMHMKTGN